MRCGLRRDFVSRAPVGSARRSRQARSRGARVARAGSENSSRPLKAPGEAGVPAGNSDAQPDAWKQPLSLPQIMGSYAVVLVFVLSLSAAAMIGIQKMSTEPGEVGMLLAPPSAALLLIVSFLTYRFTVGRSNFEE